MITLEKKALFYKALSDPIRLKIIEYLMKSYNPKCICEISKITNREQSVIFRHIQILKNAKIINTQKEKKYLMCEILNKEKTKKILEE